MVRQKSDTLARDETGIENGKWYKIRISYLNSVLRTWIDDKPLLESKVAAGREAGHFALGAEKGGEGEFKNMKIITPEGEILFEGMPSPARHWQIIGKGTQLAALAFQYGRYLLISSSQPGGQPANLQGLWNDKLLAPWDGKYTININLQMNYWPAEVTNLSEMHQPLFQLIKELSETGKETARVMYGAKGWMAHHNTDIWRITGPVDGAYWCAWPNGGAWLCEHLWQHYL